MEKNNYNFIINLDIYLIIKENNGDENKVNFTDVGYIPELTFNVIIYPLMDKIWHIWYGSGQNYLKETKI